MADQLTPVFTAVVFDLDDTLAVTEADRTSLLETAADRASVPLTFGREAYLEAHSEHSGTESRLPVFESLVGSDAPELTRAYRETIGDALAPIEGVEAVLSTLQARYRVGLLTDGPGETQHDKLRRLGWSDAFDAVVVTGPIGAPKPDRRGFEAITDELAVRPEETVYVGDHPERDIVGASAAGLLTVQVQYDDGPGPHPDADATIRREEFDSLPLRLETLRRDRADDA
ncbi:HAD family hydrolase [Natronomonas salsuginis]|uniref:HAD family hydrolase n=1 Tax=Natronomonas salsuginis TaxID=2217661 RepID=UPI001C9E8E31|nr:HAD family hydrolase [Natronomonas salsuginis]